MSESISRPGAAEPARSAQTGTRPRSTSTRTFVDRALRLLTVAGAFTYGYIVISWPTGFELSRASLQVKLFILGVVAAVLFRSLWSVIFVPAAVIFSVVLAGITHSAILNFRQFGAAAYNTEVWMFPATALGAFLATLLPRIVRRVIHFLAHMFDEGPAPAEEQSSRDE